MQVKTENYMHSVKLFISAYNNFELNLEIVFFGSYNYCLVTKTAP